MQDKRFPLYRKSINGKSIYKIESETLMEEIQLLGKSFLRHQLEAKILPERNLILDLINLEGDLWVEISSSAYEETVNHIFNHLSEIK